MQAAATAIRTGTPTLSRAPTSDFKALPLRHPEQCRRNTLDRDIEQPGNRLPVSQHLPAISVDQEGTRVLTFRGAVCFEVDDLGLGHAAGVVFPPHQAVDLATDDGLSVSVGKAVFLFEAGGVAAGYGVVDLGGFERLADDAGDLVRRVGQGFVEVEAGDVDEADALEGRVHGVAEGGSGLNGIASVPGYTNAGGTSGGDGGAGGPGAQEGRGLDELRPVGGRGVDGAGQAALAAG